MEAFSFMMIKAEIKVFFFSFPGFEFSYNLFANSGRQFPKYCSMLTCFP
uniref:Uncharacterized protein n=1 Tax=Rhizophora mucronata TaxID=61149 RepID=A0A2P2QR65_RHIMU